MPGMLPSLGRPRNVLHVGYPKAASSSVQTRFLARARRHLYLSRVTNGAAPEAEAVYEEISRALLKGRFVQRARRRLREHAGGTPYIYSDERVLFPSGVHNQPPVARLEACAELFGPARVLVVLRRPSEQLRSAYGHFMQHKLRHEGLSVTRSIDEWIGPDPEGSLRRRADMSAAIHFGTIVARACALFGRRNVVCVFLDTLRAEGDAVYPQLAEALGLGPVELGRGLANRSDDNRWLRRVRRDPGFRPEMSPGMRARIAAITRREAEVLREATGLAVPASWLAGEVG